ncbi:MAG: hypothetical protein RMK52_00690 [Chitinophagales bacterium]|nr:hypothetical protein [Chitinophagales bacterium]MDW8392743.1 hypothetical protein [Chitinophagales bacterium]
MAYPKKRGPRNNRYFGAFLGIVFPVAGWLLFYLFAFYDKLTLREYWDFLFSSGNMAAALSLALIANLPVFIYFMSENCYETMKGVLGVTLFYGLLIVLFKFF